MTNEDLGPKAIDSSINTSSTDAQNNINNDSDTPINPDATSSLNRSVSTPINKSLDLFPTMPEVEAGFISSVISRPENQAVMSVFLRFVILIALTPFILLFGLNYTLRMKGYEAYHALLISCISALSLVAFLSFYYVYIVYKQEMKIYNSSKEDKSVETKTRTSTPTDHSIDQSKNINLTDDHESQVRQRRKSHTSNLSINENFNFADDVIMDSIPRKSNTSEHDSNPKSASSSAPMQARISATSNAGSAGRFSNELNESNVASSGEETHMKTSVYTSSADFSSPHKSEEGSAHLQEKRSSIRSENSAYESTKRMSNNSRNSVSFESPVVSLNNTHSSNDENTHLTPASHPSSKSSPRQSLQRKSNSSDSYESNSFIQEPSSPYEFSPNDENY